MGPEQININMTFYDKTSKKVNSALNFSAISGEFRLAEKLTLKVPANSNTLIKFALSAIP